jgi:peptidyl-prolyl cis-trans isomerase D
MSRIRSRAAALVLTFSLAACGGLKDALTAHVDTVARAGSQELTVQRLAQMMAAANAPARKDVALAIANIWVNYQLLGEAAAHGDSLNDPKLVDDAMWAQIAQLKLKKLMAAVDKAAPKPDPSTFEKRYNDGELLAAHHILFMAQKNVMKPAARDSVRRKAEAVAKQVTPANFAAMAKKYSADPGTKDSGGALGVFARGKMVPEFENGVLALKPGQISGVVETQYGYHIIMRDTWAQAKDKVAPALMGGIQQTAESTYTAGLENAADIKAKPDAGKTIRAVAADLDAFRDDKTDVATSKKVDLTAAGVAKWMAAYPPQARIREQIQQLPDSIAVRFAKQLIVNDLMLMAADSAKDTLDTSERANLRQVFSASVENSYAGLGITPADLATTGKTVADREKIASARIEKFMDALLSNKAQFVDVSEPVSRALRSKYEARVISGGIDRAVTEAGKLLAKADSAKAKAMPQSEVPAPGAAPPPAKSPAPPAPPAPAKKP